MRDQRKTEYHTMTLDSVGTNVPVTDVYRASDSKG